MSGSGGRAEQGHRYVPFSLATSIANADNSSLHDAAIAEGRRLRAAAGMRRCGGRWMPISPRQGWDMVRQYLVAGVGKRSSQIHPEVDDPGDGVYPTGQQSTRAKINYLAQARPYRYQRQHGFGITDSAIAGKAARRLITKPCGIRGGEKLAAEMAK